MKSAVSLTLIVSLIGSALPATAQERLDEPASGPIARTVGREAARLVASQPDEPADQDWSDVRKLRPGTEIVVTAKGSPPVNRYFVTGDDSDLTLLNVSDPALPTAVSDVLRDVASTHPEYFQAAQKGGRFVLEKNVGVGPDGVFVAARKVA